MKLTDALLRNLTDPGKHFDGGGLYLELTPAGGKYWRLKYRHGGKEKRLAFGVYPAVTLKAARDRAANARKVIERGGDPGELRKAAKVKAVHESVNTLEAVSRDWLAHQAARWAPVTLDHIRASLKPTFSKRWEPAAGQHQARRNHGGRQENRGTRRKRPGGQGVAAGEGGFPLGCDP
jgi:hypothetical protein